MKHVNVTVSGKVQGVFFRASAKTRADELHITGTVKNEADGTVYIEAEGDPENVESFIDWCRRGPQFARVDECIVTEGGVRNFEGFEIVR